MITDDLGIALIVGCDDGLSGLRKWERKDLSWLEEEQTVGEGTAQIELTAGTGHRGLAARCFAPLLTAAEVRAGKLCTYDDAVFVCETATHP